MARRKQENVTRHLAFASNIGTVRRLHELDTVVRCIAIQPATAKEGIKGLKHMPTAIRPLIYDETVADGVTAVTAKEARQMMHLLAQKEGILVGPQPLPPWPLPSTLPEIERKVYLLPSYPIMA